MKTIELEDVTSRLRYCAADGNFYWKESPTNSVPAGSLAGTVAKNGYRQIHIAGSLYYAHRLAWLWRYGEMPKGHIDHINHDRLDNRLTNLRVVDHLENNRNQKLSPHNTSGHTGVTWDKQNKKWQAQISINDRVKKLGRYRTIDEAVAARKAAEAVLGFHPNHGRAAS